MLAPPEGLRTPGVGVNPGVGGVGVRGQPWGSRGDPKVIPRRFKRKKIFVTDEGWTDRRDSRNSDVDFHHVWKVVVVLVQLSFS